MKASTMTMRNTLSAVARYTLRYPMASVAAVVVVAVAALLLFVGLGKRLNVGGILGTLFGRAKDHLPQALPWDAEKDKPAGPLPGRVDDAGQAIAPGQADEHGWTEVAQVDVVDRSHNPFRDKGVVEIAGEGGAKEALVLPKGVQDTDVDKVVRVSVKDFRVTLKAKPNVGKVSQSTIDYLKGK